MPPLFRRRSRVICFFCQSIPTPAPANPRAFKCPQCDCWNRYDSNGELVSDEPAMHDETLNAKSFAKRAAPSKNHLPSIYATTRTSFCHTCQTNQMLIVNLLSNYLPSPRHPDYAKRLEMLPEYKESLHVRYPPVCENCAPSVEEEIQQKDHMARTKALGGWLRQTKGRDRQRQVSSAARERDKLWSHLLAWRIRGVLWAMTFAGVLVCYTAVVCEVRPPFFASRFLPILPPYFFVSLLWTAWDPTYYSFRKAQLQGRDVRLRGKREYIVLQLLAWGWRVFTSSMLFLSSRDMTESRPHYLHLTSGNRSFFILSLLVELSVIIGSLTFLRLDHPPPIRLIQTSDNSLSRASSVLLTPEGSFTTARSTPGLLPTGSTRTSYRSLEPDLSVLSLSSKPTVLPPSSRAVFGHPSFASTAAATATTASSPSLFDESAMELERDMDTASSTIDVDAMDVDWQPTTAPRRAQDRQQQQEGWWLRPQRFFAPEQPTGLEALFASTRLEDSSGLLVGRGSVGAAGAGSRRWVRSFVRGNRRSLVGAIALLLSIAAAFLAGRSLRRPDDGHAAS